MAANPNKSVATVAVTATATALSVYGGQNFLARMFQNKGSNTIYLGGSDVTDSGATGGIRVLSGATFTDGGTKADWYAICASGQTASVTVTEFTGAPGTPMVLPPVLQGLTADATDVEAAIVDALTTSPSITGTDAAQGLTLVERGGNSSGAGNAGGLASYTGGSAGAGGIGGAVSEVGGAGGAGSSTTAGGAGGASNQTGGAGGAKADTGNAAGGAGGLAAQTGGAGGATASSGSDAGGAGGLSRVVGGVGGAASAGTGSGGAGAVAQLTGGAGGNSAGGTGGLGGNVILTPGAVGTGGTPKVGAIRNVGPIFRQQVTPSTPTTALTLTIANLLKGILTATPSAGSTAAYTMPLATDIEAAVQMSNDDSFDFCIQNIAAAAADTITLTVNTGVTIVGNPIVQSAHVSTGGVTGNSAMFRVRKTATDTFVVYRIA